MSEPLVEDARRREDERLRRFRRWWIIRYSAVLAAAAWVVAAVGPEVIPGPTGAEAALGFPGYLVLTGVVAAGLFMAPFAAVRLVAILRTRDLASFERKASNSN